MELRTRFCDVLWGLILLLSSCFLAYECRRLNGYKFPVYATKHCPRNQAEWNERSYAINCTAEKGYVCLPNENLTELLEFCYIYPFILIQEGICLYLSKRYSLVDSYSCTGFQFGCPNTSFVSSTLFENPQCTSIGNGCFRADPSCPDATSTSYIPESSKDWFLIGTISGVFIIACFAFVCFLFIKHRKGIRNCVRYQDVENQEENERLLLNIKESCVEELPQDQVLIKFWEEDNTQFVETKASKEVERRIHSKDMVIVTGHTGSGKSAIVHHIALKYRSQGWNVKPVCSMMEIIQTINSRTSERERTFFVLNDPIGKDSFDEIEYTLWRKYEETLKACLNKMKFLMSSRKYILNDAKVKGLLKVEANIVDISNDQFKLSRNEKEEIWNKYSLNKNVSSEEFLKIIQTEAYFPLLCKLCFSKKIKEHRKLRFFTEPAKVLEDEIKAFRLSFKDKYCALVLLVLFNNDLNVQDVLGSTVSTEKYNLALKLCGMKKNSALHTIDDALGTLHGFFVKKISNTYQFYHDFVMEITSYVFGKDYPLQIIKYADIGFLRKRVTLKCCNDNNNDFTISLSDKHIDALGKRLFNDIFGERLLDVVLNPCLKNEQIIRIFMNELEHNPEKLKLLLEKKELQIDHLEVNQLSNHFFWSKLAFVILEERISPLSVIIIFCDTRLSLYCLNALQKMPEYLIGNSLFTSVCCNGSTDVFDMLIKDRIKESLAETWNFLYPIHIASAFNNNDILRILLQNGANVNLKTTNENYWTPLTLATGTQMEENNENVKITQSKRNGTVELLLNNGADIDLCKENGASPLYLACQEGHDKIVQLLLSKGADLNKCTKNGASPLTIACQEGHESIVKTLVNSGADINSTTEDGSNPLFKACQKGHYETVKVLLDNGADINLGKKDGTSPLFTACQEGHASIVDKLLEKKANINLCKKDRTCPLFVACQKGYEIIAKNLLENKADLNISDKNGDRPLHVACQNGNSMIPLYLLQFGADVNLCNKSGASPLYIACQNGHPIVVKFLLQNEADIDLCKKNGKSPLYIACQNGHDDIVQELLLKGANVNMCSGGGTSPLFVACQYQHETIVEHLLKNEADVNACVRNGSSPLVIASEYGHDNIVQILLRSGAYINLKNNRGCSPLYKACKYGHFSIVQLLLNNGANINVFKGQRFSPFHIACERGYESIVQLLLSNGVDINICNKIGASPLHIACQHGIVNIVQLLLSSGADMNLCDKYGASPLYRACEHGYDSIVQVLLSKDADINLCLKTGESPLHIACKNNFESIVQLLVSKGADIDLVT